MQVSRTNDVKIYNLSAGKTLPEWISERKRRQLVKQVGQLDSWTMDSWTMDIWLWVEQFDGQLVKSW